MNNNPYVLEAGYIDKSNKYNWYSQMQFKNEDSRLKHAEIFLNCEEISELQKYNMICRIAKNDLIEIVRIYELQ